MDIPLNGSWQFFVDEKKTGIIEQWYSPEWVKNHQNEREIIQVPSNYNTLPGLSKYVGVVWYFKKMPPIPDYDPIFEYFIEFEGINYEAQVWINGNWVGNHRGGFLPFRFPLSPELTRNSHNRWIAVRVDTSFDVNAIPSDNTDWYNWGGIHRNCQIVVLEKTRVKSIQIRSSLRSKSESGSLANINVSYTVKNVQTYLDRCYLEQNEPQVEYEIYYLGRFFAGEQQLNKVLIQTGVQYLDQDSNSPVEPTQGAMPSLDDYFKDVDISSESNDNVQDLESFFSNTDENQSEIKKESQGNIISKDISNTINVELNNPSLWTPDSPELYEFVLRLNGIDQDKHVRFGIRQIITKGSQLLLNGKPLRLKGVNLHEEQMPFGRHYPISSRRSELIQIKSMGFNSLRSSHYSHDAALVRLADEEGLLILEEIPVYWDVAFSNRKTLLLAAQMLKDLIIRDINNPSVIIWSVGNEVPTERIDCQQFILTLMDWVRKLDSSRLVMYTSCRFTADHIRRESDINALNAYFGWYYGKTSHFNFVLDMVHSISPKNPVIMTEFGAGAKIGVHGVNRKFSEENQAQIISQCIEIFNSKPYVAGWFIWIYRDFKSALRQNKFQNGFNRKGIVDEYNNEKLVAKLMGKLIDRERTDLHQYRFLAPLLGHIFYYLESFLMRIGMPLGYRMQRKMVSNYYSKIRENID